MNAAGKVFLRGIVDYLAVVDTGFLRKRSLWKMMMMMMMMKLLLWVVMMMMMMIPLIGRPGGGSHPLLKGTRIEVEGGGSFGRTGTIQRGIGSFRRWRRLALTRW